MSTVIPFPKPARLERAREPSLREILISRGIEPTGDEQRRKRRERAQRRKVTAAPDAKEET
jgi:hypothetical protein